MTTSVNEPIEFLAIAGTKGFLNEHTVSARRTACNKLFEILDADQKNVEYVRDNLDVVKARFSNLNKDVAGTTVDEYARRVTLVINDFTAWKADRAGWERSISTKQAARPAGEGDKKPRAPKAGKSKSPGTGSGHGAQEAVDTNSEARVVTFPIRADFDIEISLPRAGLSVSELKKLVYFLLPYAPDWEPNESSRTVFPILDRDDLRNQ